MQTKPFKRHLLFRILIWFLALGVTAAAVYSLRPRMYTATAYMQILMEKPYFVFCEDDKTQNYNNYVQTQFDLIRSPLIVEKALESPEIANLPIFLRQQDKVAYLVEKLQLQARSNSEVVTVSFSAHIPRDAENIVNAVVSTYFDYYVTQIQDRSLRLLNQLNLELGRQRTNARLLQDRIRAGMEQAAQQAGASKNELSGGLVQGESIQRDLYLNESKLDFLRAEIKMLQEYINDTAKLIPPSQIQDAIANGLELKALQGKKYELLSQADLIKKFAAEEVTMKMSSIQDQIENLDREIEKKSVGIAETKSKEIQFSLTKSLEQSMIDKKMEARTQEIYVEHLKSKFKDYIKTTAMKTTAIVDVSFQQEQLKRVNSIIDQLETRIVTLDTEKNAPPRVELKKKAVTPVKCDGLW